MINSIIPGYNIYVPLYKRTSFKMPFKGDTADFSLHQKKLNFKEKTDAIKKLTNNEYVGKLGQEKINHIVENITPAAYKYLDRLLYLSKGTDTEKIMYYIKNNNLSEQEIAQKLNSISELNKKILQYKDKYFKKFSDFSYDIESTSGGQLFTSDVLNKNSNIKSIDKSLELVIKTIEHSFEKIELKYTNDLERVIKKRFLSLDVISNIAPILTAARCLSNDVFNELWFNNRADLDHYFYPKLNAFEEKDYEIMYNTCYNCYQLNNNNIEPVSLKNKIQMFNILAMNRKLYNKRKSYIKYEVLNGKKYKDIDRPVINFEELKLLTIVPALLYAGLSKNDAVNYIENYKQNKDIGKNHWDTDFSYLLAAEPSSQLGEIIYHATKGDFQDYIFNPKNRYGCINKKTEKIFTNNCINYEKWLNPKIFTNKLTLNSFRGEKETLHIDMWKRIPQESIFDGNYTTCCTGIGKAHGDSFAKYMLYTAFQMLEIKNDNGDVIGMSRVFLAKINGEVSLILDNIEVNNKFIKKYLCTDENRYRYRKMIFDYVRELSKKINMDKYREIPVYFCGNYFKVKNIDDGLRNKKCYKPSILGEIPKSVYINSHKGIYVKDYDDEEHFTLIDIT